MRPFTGKALLVSAFLVLAVFLTSCGGPRVASGPKSPELCQTPAPRPRPVVPPQEDLSAQARAQALERIRRERIYFAYDSDQILPESEANLEQIADILKEYEDISLTVQGHCDERGSVEYNMELALRRAKAAKAFLVAMGVSPGRLSISALGKKDPLVDGHSEEAWAKNRRCEFIIM